MAKPAFDNQKYLELQSTYIKERIAAFDNKLYLEFGGKLFDDEHAARVLPGFKPDSKLKMLLKLKEQAEIIIAINAADIAKNKLRGDLGITYDVEVLRLIDAFRSVGLYVGSVVITQYENQSAALKFRTLLQKQGIKSYVHYKIAGYPNDVQKIVSDAGYGKNEYIVTQRPLVIVTAPGPGSGKMATCLSQLYQEFQQGVKAGYAKFETFPVWNLPLKHPVNLAYEAATVDLNDVNMIDPLHLEAYGKTAVNYNRDVEIFPVLKAIMERISGNCPYKSPTDMGVNQAGFCINDDELCRKAGRDEIIRRYYQTAEAVMRGNLAPESLAKIKLLLSQAGASTTDRKVVQAALDKAETAKTNAMAIELADGTVVCGRRTSLLDAPAACLLNALKVLGNIADEIPLISPEVIEPVAELKTGCLGNNNPMLHVDEVLLALAISAASNKVSRQALQLLPQLRNTEAHSTVIPGAMDRNILHKLGINVTNEAQFRTKKLYH